MKKILVGLIVVMLGLMQASWAADVMPQTVSTKYTATLGLYQASNEITLYKEPRENAPVVHSIKWNEKEVFPDSINFSDLFVVFIPSKRLALMAVTDETEDWVQVIYNNSDGSTGWMKKDDPYKFLSWLNFYNMYGRKYGLYVLKDAPETVNDLHSATDDSSQIVTRMKMPEFIKLHAVKGNWVLVSVSDIEDKPKTGYIRWRADNGIKYLFPAIK